MINNFYYYNILKMDNKFDEYIKRHSKYKKKMYIETFLLICRISYILGEPIKNIVKGLTNIKYDIKDELYHTI